MRKWCETADSVCPIAAATSQTQSSRLASRVTQGREEIGQSCKLLAGGQGLSRGTDGFDMDHTIIAGKVGRREELINFARSWHQPGPNCETMSHEMNNNSIVDRLYRNGRLAARGRRV
mgnify:CR=1 FL=1